MNQQESARNHLYRKIMKILSQAKDRIRWLITIWCTSLFRCRKKDEIFGCESSCDKGMEEARSDSSLAVGRSSAKSVSASVRFPL